MHRTCPTGNYKPLGLPPGLYKAVGVAPDHGLALRADGTVVAWSASGPVQVPALVNAGEDVKAIAAGSTNLVLKSNGTVVAWAPLCHLTQLLFFQRT